MTDNKNNLEHLKEFGEMGKRISEFDWSQTSLGNPSLWPAALTITTSMMLENKFAMWIVWGDEHIQLYNDGYAKILGSKHPQALGIPAKKTWHEIWDFVEPLFKDVHSGKAVQFDNQKLEVEIDGKLQTRYYTFGYTPLRNSDHSVGGVLNTVFDTTNEFIIQQELIKSESKFRNLLDQSTLPFFSVNPDWVVDYMNPAATNMLGMDINNILQKNLWEIYPGLEETVFGDSYKRAMHEREQVSFVGYYPNFDRWYQVNAYPYNEGIGISFIDVSEGKKMEEKLNEALTVRDDFLSISSHELNTPLTSLKIQTQLLNRDIVLGSAKAFERQRVTRFAEHTEKQVTRMTRLIEDMLDVARIRSGKLTIKKEKLELMRFMEEFLLRAAPLFKDHSMSQPLFEMSGCETLIVHWDPLRIEQVLNNLVSNAIRYGKKDQVSIKIECSGDKAVVSVTDRGIGMDKKALQVIFNRFQRVSNVQQNKGLGLGLYIANQIILAHGGIIRVESELEKGSTFSVELPVN